MKSALILMSILALLVSCGKEDKGKDKVIVEYRQPEDASKKQVDADNPTATPAPGATTPSEGNAVGEEEGQLPDPSANPVEEGPEGDFSGIASIATDGSCSILSGEDNETVTCSLTQNQSTNHGFDGQSASYTLTINYPELQLTRLPVCTFQTFRPVSGTPIVSELTEQKVTVELIDNSQPQFPSFPPFPPPRPPHDPCNPSPCPPQFDPCDQQCPRPTPLSGNIVSFYCKVSG